MSWNSSEPTTNSAQQRTEEQVLDRKQTPRLDILNLKEVIEITTKTIGWPKPIEPKPYKGIKPWTFDLLTLIKWLNEYEFLNDLLKSEFKVGLSVKVQYFIQYSLFIKIKLQRLLNYFKLRSLEPP